jgi:hypothetical protein
MVRYGFQKRVLSDTGLPMAIEYADKNNDLLIKIHRDIVEYIPDEVQTQLQSNGKWSWGTLYWDMGIVDVINEILRLSADRRYKFLTTNLMGTEIKGRDYYEADKLLRDLHMSELASIAVGHD